MIHSSLFFVSFKEYGLHLVEGSLPLALKYIACGREKNLNIIFFMWEKQKTPSNYSFTAKFE